MIKLYIDSQLIELTAEVQIEYTYNSLDVLEPTAIKNSFSKTIAIPGTKNNNEVFGHIYRLDRNLIEDPDSLKGINFDPRKRVPFYITRYGGTIESGYIQMNSIDVNDGQITYNITCYSGLGDFFYNLMSNEDGTDKTLADLYYKWKPVFFYDDKNEVLTREQEDSLYLMNLSSSVMARSFEQIKPIDTKRFATDITEDITVIPVYNGLYENFSSDTFLMDNFENMFDYPNNFIGPQGEVITDELYKYVYDTLNPIESKDDQFYTTVEYPAGSKHKWMLVKLEREVEPFEARDLRVTNMNIGLKLSKLMNAISDPENNGGYTVEWDEDITNSLHWNYSWIMLDKPDYEKNNISDPTVTGANVGSLPGWANQSIQWQYTPYSTKNYLKPVLRVDYKPTFYSFIEGFITGANAEIAQENLSKLSMFDWSGTPSTRQYKWAMVFTVWDIYNDNTKLSQYHTMHYNGCGTAFGGGLNNEQIADVNTMISNIRMSMEFGVRDFQKNSPYTFVNQQYGPAVTDMGQSAVDVRNLGWGHLEWYAGQYVQDLKGELNSAIFSIPLTNDIDNLRVTARSYEICYIQGPNGWTVTIDGQPAGNQNFYKGLVHLFRSLVNNEVPKYTINYVLNDGGVTTVQEDTNEYSTSLARANKQILLGGSETPYKYLTDFTKLLNIKYIFDRATKTIRIMPKNKYYKNEIIDISDKIDISKQRQIKPIITDTKYISMELETPETHAEKLYLKKNPLPYGSFRFNTKYEFNNDTKNIFDSVIYTELIPYSHVSNFFNYDSQAARFMSIFSVVSHTNTLFRFINSDTVDINDKKDTLYNFKGSDKSKFNAYAKDPVPKLCTFDKDNNNLSECKNSFVFLNGFYRNYYYEEQPKAVGTNWILYPYFMLSDDVPVMNTLLNNPCYVWSFNWGKDYPRQLSVRSLIMKYSAAPMFMPYFGKYLYNKYTDTEFGYRWSTYGQIEASWTINRPTQVFTDSKDMKFVEVTPWVDTVLNIKPGAGRFLDIPELDYLSSNKYIYPQFWKSELEDLYDKDGKQVVLYARLDDEPDEQLRKFYFFDGCVWMITKIENYNITDNNNWFNKITFVKVKNILSYIE